MKLKREQNHKNAGMSADAIVQKTIQCSKMIFQHCGIVKPMPKTVGLYAKVLPIRAGFHQKFKVYTLDVVTLEVVPLCN